MYQNTWKKLPSSGFVPLMDIKKRFGLAVKERRGALGISQEELAMRIGTDQAYVSRLKRAG
jgi:predicted transcriptional regulator